MKVPNSKQTWSPRSSALCPSAVPLPGRLATGLQAVRDRGLRALQGRPVTGLGSLPLPCPTFGADPPPPPVSRSHSGRPAAEVQPGSRAHLRGSAAPAGQRLPTLLPLPLPRLPARSSRGRRLEGPRLGLASRSHHTPSPCTPPVRAVREGRGTSCGLPVLRCLVWPRGLSSRHADSRHSRASGPLRSGPALGRPPGAWALPPVECPLLLLSAPHAVAALSGPSRSLDRGPLVPECHSGASPGRNAVGYPVGGVPTARLESSSPLTWSTGPAADEIRARGAAPLTWHLWGRHRSQWPSAGWPSPNAHGAQ